LLEKLSGLSISESAIEAAFHKSGLKSDKPTTWSKEDLHEFARELLALSKPMLFAANKCDQSNAKQIISELRENLESDSLVVPCAAEAELLLRRASQAGLIDYVPGDATFSIKQKTSVSAAQKKALDIVEKILEEWKSTGVQKAINDAYLSLLKGIVVYPVEDESKFTDRKGNVLPDARIMHQGDTARDLAFSVHTDLGKTFLYAIDARTGLRVGADHELKNNDVLKIVSTGRRG
jgi:ribosome-binding ATPase